jgi:hypothetical protein
MNWDLHTTGKEEYALEMSELAYNDEQAELAYEAIINILLVALRGHMEICGPLCPEHGDPRDTNIDIGRE